MSERIDEERLSEEAERARQALRGMDLPGADPVFRDRLKRDFVSGAIEVTGSREGRRRGRKAWGRDRRRGTRAGVPGAVVPGAAVPRGGSERARPFPIWARGKRAATWTAVAAAAAAALVFVFGALNRGPTWWVTAARGEGTIRVDGQTVALDDRDAMRRLLTPGAEIEVAENAELDLCSNGVVALQLTPGTRMTLPPPPGRWMGRSTELYARGGELRVATGSSFKGARLLIVTPHAAVEATGTTFAVIMEDAGTCVCVLEGTAMVGPRTDGESHGMEPVPSGTLRYVFQGPRPPERGAMRQAERGKLALFRESQRPWLEKSETQD